MNEATPLTACSTGHGTLTEAAEFAGAWDDPECAAHHRKIRARSVSFTVSQDTAVSISLEGGVLFVSQRTPKNGCGTPPNSSHEDWRRIRRDNGKLLHDGIPMPGRTGSR